MRDFPVFTTAYGVASLTLSQIPYTKTAYIRLQDTLDPEALLEECLAFCRLAGAETVYATGHTICEKFPLYTYVYKMQADRISVGETEAMLFPVTAETASVWQRIYNQKVLRVPNGAWMDESAMKKQLTDGGCYFVHSNGELIGIGSVLDQQIRWVAAVVSGAGKDVVRALLHVVTEETVFLEVASANSKALSLYQALGFVSTECLSSWYCVYEKY